MKRKPRRARITLPGTLFARISETCMTIPSPQATEHRLTELEHGLRHCREMQRERNEHLKQMVKDLRTNSEQQDAKIARQIGQIYRLLWQVIWWAIIFLVGTLSTITLKALNLL